MKNFTRFLAKGLFLSLLLVSFMMTGTYAQSTVTVSGTVTDDISKETLIGVNVRVKGTVLGTTTDFNGKFNLKINEPTPITLIFSSIGYTSKEVVVSASRVEESILQSPVSIEKMDILAIRETASDNYYKGIANLKGVDVTTSSINFQIVNARGFNSTGNTRFVQLTDGMDTQAPALNFPIGNLNGPSELDVESVEFIPGAASALYGPNAFNGILLVNSKNPFEYQGLSATYKQGVNHLNGQGNEPSSPQPMYEASIRYAKAFNNKFAFKVNASYSAAEDWYGTDQSDLNSNRQPAGFSFNPGENRVNVFGDEVATNVGLLANSGAFQQAANANGLGSYLGLLPNQVVTRTGYDERDLVDYNAKNFKLNGGLYYRITNKAELSYSVNYGAGTTVYTGAQRYSLKDFSIIQHKVELKGDNFFLRAYGTIEDSGESYIADLTGVNINSTWKDNSTWYAQYGLGYLGALAQQGVAPNGMPTAQQQMVAHMAARGVADQGRIMPGTPQFEAVKNQVINQFIPQGALFNDKSAMYHAEGQYDFKNEIDVVDLQVGASYRLYDMNSNGTIFADVPGNDITISEYGAYAQVAKRLLNDKLKLTGSVRYDKNENFDGQFSPRLSAVLTQNNHNIRLSYQTGFRMPTTQAQHIDLNVVSARLIGGLPFYRDRYQIFENSFTLASVNAYTEAVASGVSPVSPAATSLLQPVTTDLIPELRPEQVQSIELGYKSLLSDNRLLIDAAFYYNRYTDFISQTAVRKAPGPVFPVPANGEEAAINAVNAPTLLTPVTTPGQENTFQTYTNIVGRDVEAAGAAIGMTYSLPNNYTLGGNYNWNRLLTDLGEEFLAEFNTPEHKFNVSFGNRKLTEKLGFNVAYRWQSAFRWESTFAIGDVPAVQTLDAQVSYKLKDIKSIIKLGASNVLNERYFLNYGGPTVGGIYYISITFDELMN